MLVGCDSGVQAFELPRNRLEPSKASIRYLYCFALSKHMLIEKKNRKQINTSINSVD